MYVYSWVRRSQAAAAPSHNKEQRILPQPDPTHLQLLGQVNRAQVGPVKPALQLQLRVRVVPDTTDWSQAPWSNVHLHGQRGLLKLKG